MKKILILSLCTASFFSGFAQTQKIVLSKNQRIKFVTTLKGSTSIDAVVQKMDIATDVRAEKNIIVTDIQKDNYKVDFTTTKMKMNLSMMGENKKYDSDDKSDTAGEFKDLGKNINIPQKLLLSFSGKGTLADTTAKVDNAIDKANPFAGILGKAMSEGASEPKTLENFFMLIPAGKKLKSTWSDSTINGDDKVYNTYTWDSTTANIATIKIISKATTKINTEMADLNLTLDATINSVVNETRKVNLTSGIIPYKTSTTTIDGSAEMMGMPLPITGTTETTTSIVTE